MITAALTTLGCKVNQCETAYLEEQLAAAGFQMVPFSRRADLYCIGTCVVTGRAAMQSRQLIRRAIRQNPEARVVAMGCYPQIAASEVAAIQGVTHILGTVEKLALLSHLTTPAGCSIPIIRAGDARCAPEPQPLVLTGFPHRTRAFLKVQDGCNAFCSYCVVPLARGRSRSIRRKPLLEQVRRFLDNGYQEIVLTGIHLGQWGGDLEPEQNLVALLRAIIGSSPPPRLRLSSLEPGEITSDLLGLMAVEPVLCPHLHVPLQSGDATILQRMNRHYEPRFYRDRVYEAISRIPDLAVGADVLAGFPGETDQHFQNTYGLLESLPLAYLHIFPFSPRPGTAAAKMKERVAPPVIRRRCDLLRQLDRFKRLAFTQRFIGKVRPVLLESRRDRISGGRCGFSDNYLPVVIPDGAARGNRVIMARFDRLEGTRMVGSPV
jgi:threonylcarbamoyladenosine tRNA methylthiotransferase MtaB